MRQASLVRRDSGGTAPRTRYSAKVAATYADIKRGAIPGTAGTLLTFVYRMRVGDLVVYPHRPDSTLNFGRILGDYEYHPELPFHPNRRKVEWLRTGVPRTDFTEPARFEVGSAITLFQVKRHLDEFLAFLDDAQPITPPPVTVDPEDAEEVASTAVSAERIENATRDFVVATLMRDLEGADFERFVAHLLQCMGYRTRVTQASGDGGVDIIAHKDPLGLEPPIIKVQCKRSTSPMGGPVVQNLVGTLSPGGSELGLFVTLGSFSKDATHIERTRQDLRLINGKELVDLIFAHYEQLDPAYKRMLPMRSVYVVRRELDDAAAERMCGGGRSAGVLTVLRDFLTIHSPGGSPKCATTFTRRRRRWRRDESADGFPTSRPALGS